MRTRKAWIPVLVAAVIAIGMWRMYGLVTPALQADALSRGLPRGEPYFSDLYPRWIGARELLLHGRDPYGPDVTAIIQRGKYGRSLDPANPAEPKDQARFAYPLFIVFLLAPTVIFPFPVVELVYRIFIVIGSAISVVLWLRHFGVQTDRPLILTGITLMLGSWPVVTGLFWSQPTMMVAILLAAAAGCIGAGRFWLAGMVLGLSMIKPQLTLPVVAWWLLWSSGNWQHRKPLAIAYGITVACLLIGSEFLLPGWLWRWWEGTQAYVEYMQARLPLIPFLFGEHLGAILWIMIAVALLFFCWRFRQASVDSDPYRLALACMSSGTLVLTPTPAWYLPDQILIVPAVIAGFLWRKVFSRLNGVRQMAVGLCVCILMAPWAVAVLYSFLTLVYPVSTSTVLAAFAFAVVFVPMAALTGVMLFGSERIRMNRANSHLQLE